MQRIVLGWSTALLLCCLGCDRGPKLVPVTGRVTYKGKPVVPGAIYFEPTSGAEGSQRRASSLLQIDGSYALRSYPYGDGAVPGKYRVHLQLGHGPKRDLALFTDSAHSPLTAIIPESGLPNHDIELAPRAADPRR